jgi:hydroxymethylglutaryl-CoA lyase
MIRAARNLVNPPMSSSIIVVETPRDAFQGLPKFVPTEEKIRYIRSLIDAGFKHIDLGSFVSHQAVPQMADSAQVVNAFRTEMGLEKIAIVPNLRGVDDAVSIGGLDGLGFPFSLSQQFQLQNTKTSSTQTWTLVEAMMAKTEKHDMSFILYLSMAFGNPYGEAWHEDSVFTMIRTLMKMGVRHISLADTVAVANPEQIQRLFARAKKEHPNIEFSAHFHARPENWFENVEAALRAGCKRFDAAAKGLGGCPFAQDTMVANIPSDELVRKLEGLGYATGVDLKKLEVCSALAGELHQKYGKN